MIVSNILSEVSNHLIDCHANLHKVIITRVHLSFVVLQF